MTIESDWARLVAEGQDNPSITRDKQLAVLLVHSRKQSIALEQVREQLEEAARQVAALAKSVDAVREQMAQDAELLKAVRATTTAAQVLKRAIVWTSGLVVALAGFWWAYYTVTGSKPDIGIGP